MCVKQKTIEDPIFHRSLRDIGSRLYVASGDPVAVLPALWAEWGVTHLTFEEDETLEPYALKRDQGTARPISLESFKLMGRY